MTNQIIQSDLPTGTYAHMHQHFSPPPLVIPNLVEIKDEAAVHVDFLKLPSPALGNSSIRNSRSAVVSSSDQYAAFLWDFGFVLPPILMTSPFKCNEWPDEVDLSDILEGTTVDTQCAVYSGKGHHVTTCDIEVKIQLQLHSGFRCQYRTLWFMMLSSAIWNPAPEGGVV